MKMTSKEKRTWCWKKKKTLKTDLKKKTNFKKKEQKKWKEEEPWKHMKQKREKK